ncbi:hypothetical protein D3C87_1423530 [compost metagenome]
MLLRRRDPLVPGSCKCRRCIRTGVADDQAGDTIRVKDAEAERHHSAERYTDEMRPCDTQLVEHADVIGDQVVQTAFRRRLVRGAMATGVNAHDAEPEFKQRFDLTAPHVCGSQDGMSEYDRRSADWTGSVYRQLSEKALGGNECGFKLHGFLRRCRCCAAR